MAEFSLNSVRILLRNDTAENWSTVNPVLMKGEMGIESDTLKIKFGDGTKAWNELAYSGISTEEVQGLINDNKDSFYSVVAEKAQEDLVALGTVAGNPKKGDIGVVKRQIAEGKFSYTAYVYGGEAWEAADGNYSVDNVYFGNDLTITAPIGVQTIDASGSKTLATTGKNVKQVFDMLVAEEKNPTTTQPSVAVTLTGAGAKEAGSKFTPSYTASLNPGKYQFGPATGVVATSWSVTDTAGGSADTATGKFAEFTVEDGTNYTITATANYNEGAVPVTNLGNEYPAGKIVAGSKNKVSASVTAYRNSFYGTTANKDALDDAAIRSLAGKSNKTLANGAKFDVSVPVGAMRVVIAYPASLRDMSSALDVNGLNAESVSSFKKQEINVSGANAYSPIAYKVFTLEFANANDKANTFKVTI